MRIGFDAKRAFLNTTGLGNYSRNTLNALKKYYPEHDYVLFTPEIREELFPEKENFEVYSPDNSATKLLKSLWRSISLNRIITKHEIDIFHGLSHELPAGIQKSKVRSVVTIHDLIFMRFPKYYSTIDRRIYYQKVKLSTHCADKIIAISNQTKEDIIKYLKVDPKKIEVVYQPINENFFTTININEQDIVLQKYNLPPKFILALGTIEARKNHLNILKAIKSNNIDIPLAIVGKPTTYVQKLLDFVIENKMEEQVFFLDNVTNEDLPVIYNRASFLVYISVFEGFGLPIIEAMASGCPVVTSSTSCLPEVASDGAILCNPGNIDEIGECFMKIIGDNQLRDDLIQKGKKRALNFSPHKSVESLMNVYKKVITNA